jgi:hypothetical protein
MRQIVVEILRKIWKGVWKAVSPIFLLAGCVVLGYSIAMFVVWAVVTYQGKTFRLVIPIIYDTRK